METSQLPPVEFIGIIDRHIGMEPVKYDFHPGTETPHLFSFLTQGRSKSGAATSFSINAADLRILMDQHGLLRIQSNGREGVTLYFGPRPATRSVRMPDQRSVTDQLKDLLKLANQQGLYDAADWLKTRMGR